MYEKLFTNIEIDIKKGLNKIIHLFKNKSPKPISKSVLTYTFKDDTKNILEKLDVKIENVVYLIFIHKYHTTLSLSNVEKTFKKLKYKGKNCMCKINKDHWKTYIKNKNEYCLYVGSCKDKVKSRLKHHLSKLSSTYGLHLDAWWKQDMPKISILVLEYGNKIESIYLQQIEDVLWDKYKPLFGKRGPR